MSISPAVKVCLIAFGLMAFGGLFIIHERMMKRKIERLRREGNRASAVVVDYEYRSSVTTGSTRFPVVQFEASDGRLVTAHTDFGGDLIPKIGDRVHVLFDPERPEQVHLDSDVADSANSVIGAIGWIFVVGAPMAAIPALIIVNSK